MDEGGDNPTDHSIPLPVLVEYEFFNIPTEHLGELPTRVTRAVGTLVRRGRVPSDEDVREMVQESEGVANSARSAYAFSTPAHHVPARVRVVVPHNVALDLALHRSFQEGGNVEQQSALTADEMCALVRRSQLVNIRQLHEAQRLEANVLERRRISPAINTCVICLERVRHRKDRTFLDPCGHVFHKDCIAQWLEKLPRQCPTCRVEVNLTPLPQEETTRTMTTRSQTRALEAHVGAAANRSQERALEAEAEAGQELAAARGVLL